MQRWKKRMRPERSQLRYATRLNLRENLVQTLYEEMRLWRSENLFGRKRWMLESARVIIRF